MLEMEWRSDRGFSFFCKVRGGGACKCEFLDYHLSSLMLAQSFKGPCVSEHLVLAPTLFRFVLLLLDVSRLSDAHGPKGRMVVASPRTGSWGYLRPVCPSVVGFAFQRKGELGC